MRLLTEKKQRSLTNMIEVMIRDYCRQKGGTLPEQPALFADKPEQTQD
ncbi:acetate and sugar kinases/Hsc70/actin family protein [Methylosarcina fibrata]|nr:hypothetical protein [Methylosarcina fibrata]